MSIFDQEAPIAPKRSKEKKAAASAAPTAAPKSNKTSLSAILKTSGSAVVPQSSLDTETLAAEPGITPVIQSLITKTVRTSLMIKRSALVSKIVEKQFPNLAEASDHESTAVYGMINVVITTMVQDADVQEFRFYNDAGHMVESMLVSNALELENSGDLTSDLTAELDDLDKTDATSFLDMGNEQLRGIEDEEDEAMSKAIAGRALGETLDQDSTPPSAASDGTFYPEELAAYMEGYAVVSNEPGEKQKVSVFQNAAGALHVYGRIMADDLNDAQIYGLVPVKVETRLSLGGSYLVDADTDTNLSHLSDGQSVLDLEDDQTPPSDVLSLPRADEELPLSDEEADRTDDGGPVTDGR